MDRIVTTRLAACVAALTACTGTIAGEGDPGPAPGAAAAPGADTVATPAPGASPSAPAPAPTDALRPPPPLADFACNTGTAGATPRRLWRLTQSQYVNTVTVLFAGRGGIGRGDLAPKGVVSPFDLSNESDRFSTQSASYTMADYELRRIMNYSGDVAVALVAKLRADTKSCLGAASRPPFADCIAQLVSDRGPLLFQRPLAPGEVAEYAAIATGNAAMLGEDDAAALAFQAMLSAPQFLFRSEVGAGAPDAAGTVRLTPYELAAALAYTLTDWPPDDTLWRAAGSGALSTPDELRAQVRRLVAMPSSRTATLMRFVREYFRYRELDKVFKNGPDLNPGNKGWLLGDAEQLVGYLMPTAARKDFLRTLLTTTKASVTSMTYKLYNVADPKDFYLGVKMDLPADQRAGLLTQPVWLAGFSDTTTNKPVQRGKFVGESLLCRAIPPLPIGQVPALPETPGQTLRERQALHSRDPSCWACHQLMDPIGLAFEAYEPTGRYRSTDNGKPVDASGTLSGAGASDGPVKDAVDLMTRLAASPVVEQCFVRHSFRYWMGRSEAPWDGCALVDADRAYQQAGGDYVELLAGLLSSRSFVVRSAN
jgi:hypothetical protein